MSYEVTDELGELVRRALARNPARPAIEYEGRWVTWGEIRALAATLQASLARTGAGARQPVAFIPKNRPWAIAALLGMIADERTIQMIYAFQSGAAIARNIEQLAPAVVVASPDELGPEVTELLRARGIAAIAVDGMTVSAVEGLETAAATHDAGAPVSPEIQILTSGTTG